MCNGRSGCSDLTYEIIVVDDGSRDKTAAVVQRYSEKYGSDTIRLLKLRQNLGKGGALREVGDQPHRTCHRATSQTVGH